MVTHDGIGANVDAENFGLQLQSIDKPHSAMIKVLAAVAIFIAKKAVEDFEVRALTRVDVSEWYHVYCTRSHPSTRADTFSEGWGDTRFAPIQTETGAPVYTYYVASTPEAAYMESVLHDVSLSPPGMFEVALIAHFHLVWLRLAVPKGGTEPSLSIFLFPPFRLYFNRTDNW